MSLTWHIVRKDLRRMAVPVLIWLAFVVGSMVWIRAAAPDFVGHIPSEITTWVTLLQIWGRLLVAAELVMAYLLAASLLLEDRVVGSSAFWLARPIAAGRLLAAKAMTAALCFVVAPTAVMLPVWLSVSVQRQPIVSAALQFALLHLGIVAVALTLASLSRNLAGFLSATVLGFIGLMLAIWANLLPTIVPVILGIPTLPMRVMQMGGAVLVAAVLGLQFLRRRPRQGWAALIGGLLACGTVAMRVPPRVPPFQDLAPAETATEQAAVKVAPTFKRFNVRSVPYLELSTPAGAQFLVPDEALATDRMDVLQPGGGWGYDAAAQVFSHGKAPDSLRWRLQSRSQRGATIDFNGTLDVWRAHAVVAVDVPLVEGRAAASDWGTLRIVAIDRLTSGDRDVYFEEREIDPISPSYRSYVGAFGPSSCRPLYFIVGGDGAMLRGVDSSPAHYVHVDFIEVGYRQFHVSSRENMDGARLVKVLIVPESRFVVPIEVHGVVDTDPRHGALEQRNHATK